MLSVRKRMEIQHAYREVGTYRGAAEICGVAAKTVKRAVTAVEMPDPDKRPYNYDEARELVAEKIKKTKGKISAKRLLPTARAAGYSGSPRNFRRLVAEERLKWRRAHFSGRRPGAWAPCDALVFDWGQEGPLFFFCAVLAWSRVRFVHFADNCGAEATFGALASCFEYLGGVPKVGLTGLSVHSRPRRFPFVRRLGYTWGYTISSSTASICAVGRADRMRCIWRTLAVGALAYSLPPLTHSASSGSTIRQSGVRRTMVPSASR